MTHPGTEAFDSQEFAGFDEARRMILRYEGRARVHRHLAATDFLMDLNVRAVHVDNTSRADRAFLVAFDRDGCQIDSDTLYIEQAGDHFDVTPEFDHDFTSMAVPEGSQLAAAIAKEDGWVVDMTAVRAYQVLEDTRTTERRVFAVLLGDMLNSGHASGFLLGGESDSDSDEPDAA